MSLPFSKGKQGCRVALQEIIRAWCGRSLITEGAPFVWCCVDYLAWGLATRWTWRPAGRLGYVQRSRATHTHTGMNTHSRRVTSRAHELLMPRRYHANTKHAKVKHQTPKYTERQHTDRKNRHCTLRKPSDWLTAQTWRKMGRVTQRGRFKQNAVMKICDEIKSL